MVLFFLASIAGLFPSFLLPFAMGWKAIHAFDVLFAACLGFTAYKGAFRPIDARLMAAGTAVLVASGVALWAHPSPQGSAAVTSLAYSVVVLLTVAHVRTDLLDVRVERTIVGPLAIAVGIAWVILLVENLTGIAIGRNQSGAPPSSVHRLGGMTGGNALILFLCLGGPLVRAPWLIATGVLLPALATLSRSMLGVGAALILHHRSQPSMRSPIRRAILVGSWLCVSLGLVAYSFNLVPAEPSQRETMQVSLDRGGYLTLHKAALRMFISSPLVGVGPARGADLFPRFTSDEERGKLFRQEMDPHSAILGIAAEQGLLGLLAFAWFLFEIFKRFSRIEDPHLRSGAVAGLIGLLVGGHFVDWLALKGLWFWIGLLVASRRLDTR